MRSPRYTLRSLLLAVAALCVLLAACASRVARVRREEAARKHVSRLDGTCFTERLNDNCIELDPFSRRTFLDLIPGLRSAPYIDEVSLRWSRTLSDDDISLLRSFRRLRFVDLSHTSVTDRCVPILAECHGLLRLNIANTRISGRGAAALRKELPHCIILYKQPAGN